MEPLQPQPQTTAQPTSPRPGTVTLVGGGPGAEDLLTVRALHALAAADVIYYDRLAPTESLRRWAPDAQLFDVGKRPGHHRVSQESICSMMLRSAQQGQHVVRLKGGDPYVFGRACEEVDACRAAGIEVTVVPGISSSLAAPAAAGIPVTARGVTRSVTVISGHDPLSEDELAGLRLLGGTVVVLMGVGTLAQTCTGLIRHGLAPETPVGLIARAYSSDQRTCLTTLTDAVVEASAAGIGSPAVLVIGDVVAAAAQTPHSGEALISTLPSQVSAGLLPDLMPQPPARPASVLPEQMRATAGRGAAR